MDYESLYSQLPKEPKRWTLQDVQTWLEFIGLSNLTETFHLNSIDGSCLELIEERELEHELNITHKIVRKKLVNWLTTGLKEYAQFVTLQKSQMIEEVPVKKQFSSDMITENLELTNEQRGVYPTQLCDLSTNYIRDTIQPIQQQNGTFQDTQIQNQMIEEPRPVPNNDYVSQLEKFLNKTTNELIIQPTEGPQTNFYCIKESGGKIGRHSSNQILILEESISRFHAEIICKDQNFYLRDIGSTTGTFIKVDSKVLLQVGLLIELGSNQFEVESIKLGPNFGEVNLAIIEGPNLPEKHRVVLNPQKSMINIGRKPTAEINFPDDHHLSNIHAKLVLIDGKVYLEDMGSTNGSWLRLSKEGQTSEPYILQETVFKIGTTTTYICKRQQQITQDRPQDNLCIICIENDRDALYLPCKHNTACLRCSKGLKDCPICRTKIEDTIRIYKN